MTIPRQGVHIASEPRRSNRRLDRRLASVDEILGAMRKGEALHLQYENNRPHWSLSGGRNVVANTAAQRVGRPGRRRVVSGYAGPGVEGCQMTEKPKLGLVDDAVSDDPFDLAKLRVSQDFLETTNVKKLLTTVPIRKPGSQDFVRVHPGPAYRETLAFIELKDDREPWGGARTAGRVLHRYAVHRDHPHWCPIHVAGTGAGGRRAIQRLAHVRG
jgi:hypothetical protein